ncbi:TIGR02186 family protein, partial [Agrobacterium sp. S2]|nr:TIGR02186 family protein [Agrobacterium sp. S2]
MTRHLLLAALALLSCLSFGQTASAQTPPLALPPGPQQRPLQENIEIGASTTEIPIASDFRGADFT